MADIAYEPIKKIIVHAMCRHENARDLIMTRMTPIGIMPLYWCDGVLFVYDTAKGSDASKSFMSGVLHISRLDYAEMKDYKHTIELEDEQFKGAKVNVLNYSNLAHFKDLAKWLKSTKK